MAGEQGRPLRVLAWTEKRGRAELARGIAGGYPSQEEGPQSARPMGCLRKMVKPERLTPRPLPRTVWVGEQDEESSGRPRAKATREERDRRGSSMAYLPGPLRSLSSVLSHQQPTGLWAVRLDGICGKSRKPHSL